MGFHFREMFRRVGFIVTDLETDSQTVVQFYGSKERGTRRERYEKSVEIRQFCVLPYLEKAALAPFLGCRSRSG